MEAVLEIFELSDFLPLMVISWIFNIQMENVRMPAKLSIGKEKNIMKG